MVFSLMVSSQFHPHLLSPPGPAVRILIRSPRFSANQLHLVTILSVSADTQVVSRLASGATDAVTDEPRCLQFFNFWSVSLRTEVSTC